MYTPGRTYSQKKCEKDEKKISIVSAKHYEGCHWAEKFYLKVIKYRLCFDFHFS